MERQYKVWPEGGARGQGSEKFNIWTVPFFVGVNEKTQNVDEAQNWKVHCVKHLIFLEFFKNMILALFKYK